LRVGACASFDSQGSPEVAKKGGGGREAGLGAGLVKGCAKVGAFRPPAPLSGALSIGGIFGPYGSLRP
jgi:hypothetical protein